MPHKQFRKQPRRPTLKVAAYHPSRRQLQAQKSSKTLISLLRAAEDGMDVAASVQAARAILQQPGSSACALDEAFQVFYSAGETDLAVSALKLALAQDTASIDAAYRFLALFGVSGDVGDLQNCISILMQYRTLKDHERPLVYALGRMDEFYLQAGDIQHSYETIQQLEAIDSAQLVTNIQKACHFMVTGQMDACATHMQAAWDYFVAKGAIVAIEDEGEADFKLECTDDVPEQPFLLGCIRCLTELEDYERAKLICELALYQSEDDPVLLHEMAWIFNLQEDFEECKALLERALYVYRQQGAEEMAQDIEAKLRCLY